MSKPRRLLPVALLLVALLVSRAAAQPGPTSGGGGGGSIGSIGSGTSGTGGASSGGGGGGGDGGGPSGGVASTDTGSGSGSDSDSDSSGDTPSPLGDSGTSALPLTPSCCSLTRDELASATCDGECKLFRLESRCAKCPGRACRLQGSCVDGAAFLQSSVDQAACNHSFGAIYPHSIGKEDRDVRFCRQDKASRPAPSNANCCGLSGAELVRLQGWNEKCPDGGIVSNVQWIDDKCALCPSGTCRMQTKSGHACVCPEALMDSYKGPTYFNRDTCIRAFGASYPDTLEASEPGLRSCAPAGQNVTWSAISCCALPETTLLSLVGWHKDCPSDVARRSVARCEPCPPGMCRVDDECLCPDAFVALAKIQALCVNGFSDTWPESVRKDDRMWDGCVGLRVPKLTNATVPDFRDRSIAPTEIVSILATILTGLLCGVVAVFMYKDWSSNPDFIKTIKSKSAPF